jgi:hypothetical protein
MPTIDGCRLVREITGEENADGVPCYFALSVHIDIVCSVGFIATYAVY